ncbi:Mitogen-activated protein kinase kinase kinase [Parasponia andersonii]|uniref:Mitogen-activated protein kinase kinase kinase n=1 Tax=Parasponia andersonii TaxID=3476 RepID=A0A2P5ASJ7_PARAD|nr:Mitogen-activated protein kinase kinase kinase [Parasponia andersonii]
MKISLILNAQYHLSIFIIFLCYLSTISTVLSGHSGAGENHFPKLNNSQTNLAIPNPILSPTTPAKVNPKNFYKAVGLASSATLAILLIIGLTILLRRRRRTHQLDDEEKPSPRAVVLEEKVRQLCRRFTLDEIRTATNNFDPDLKIGDGGFGRVYKGHIDNDKENLVAVKVLKSTSSQGVREFWTEIEALSKLRHPHLASLIGYCNDQRYMIIVYDYMAHGTLRDHLYGIGDSFLTWKQRLEICVEAARGLVYLHAGAEHGSIIHRDVKSSNILLDQNWVAKVSDFGLSRLGPTSQSRSHVTTDVKGTFGYLDPVYFWTKHLTTKSDVYGFGVVLFEVLCGRPAVEMGLEEEQQSLVQWARYNVKNGTLDQIVDDNLRGEIAPECLKLYGKIADRCLRSDRNRRPKMADVLKALEFALRLQEGAAAAAEEGIEIREGSKSDEKMSCLGGGNQVILRPPCKDSVVHSCPTVWGKSTSRKMLMRFFSDKAGFKWAAQPTSRALKALCFSGSPSLKAHNAECRGNKNQEKFDQYHL